MCHVISSLLILVLNNEFITDAIKTHNTEYTSTILLLSTYTVRYTFINKL